MSWLSGLVAGKIGQEYSRGPAAARRSADPLPAEAARRPGTSAAGASTAPATSDADASRATARTSAGEQDARERPLPTSGKLGDLAGDAHCGWTNDARHARLRLGREGSERPIP